MVFSEGLHCDGELLKASHNCSTSAANGSLQQLHSVDNHQVCKSFSALLPLPLSLHHGWQIRILLCSGWGTWNNDSSLVRHIQCGLNRCRPARRERERGEQKETHTEKREE